VIGLILLKLRPLTLEKFYDIFFQFPILFIVIIAAVGLKLGLLFYRRVTVPVRVSV
jgi:hypothetical protein